MTMAATNVQAQDKCALTQLASLPITAMPNGQLSIPVSVDGADEQFVFSLNVPYSSITQYLADKRQFIQKPLQGSTFRGLGYVTNAGQVSSFSTYLPSVGVGQVVVKNVRVLVTRQPLASNTVGLLSLDFLSAFDVELNLKQMKLNLFSPDHCPGNVIYWGRAYEVLPITQDEHGIDRFDMQLDGRSVSVSLDVSHDDSRMDAALATKLFGITKGDPSLKLKSDDSAQSGGSVWPAVAPGHPEATRTIVPRGLGPSFYNFAFKKLSAQGVAFNNLHVFFYPQAEVDPCNGERKHFEEGGYVRRCWGFVDVRLGRHELQSLRLFFAFQEKNLYVTAADADAPNTAPPPPSTPDDSLVANRRRH